MGTLRDRAIKSFDEQPPPCGGLAIDCVDFFLGHRIEVFDLRLVRWQTI
jgi:hypothetical protein